MCSLPLAPAADDAWQDRDQVLVGDRRDGRKRDSNIKIQQSCVIDFQIDLPYHSATRHVLEIL